MCGRAACEIWNAAKEKESMRKPQLLMGPLALALLGMAFCLWSAFGNDINFCVTAGCSLYQDFSIGGVSLWWLGMTAFAGLFLLALVGASAWGVVFSALALTGDIALLLLMVFTAPCISCLVVAVFFALSFCAFRRAYADEERRGPQRHSLLLLIWMALFLVNVGVAVRSQNDVWAINDLVPNEEGNIAPSVRMFFSPSCPSCRQGVDILSGKVDVGFYPVTESPEDLIKILAMRKHLDDGLSMAEALAQSQKAVREDVSLWSPDAVWLRFRLLRNKAHIFLAGSRTIPFFEYHGLPSMLVRQAQRAATAPANAASPKPHTPPPGSWDGTGSEPSFLNDDPIAGQCGNGRPCP